MGKFRTWLAEQNKTGVFNSKDCKYAAALYAAGRGSEAEQILSRQPPQIKHAMMQLFQRGFPEPKNMDATAQALADPKFGHWVQNKLMPIVSGTEPKKSSEH